MSEDGGLDEVEESFLAAASCCWRRATVASSAFNRASWASNFACKRRQFGQNFRALGLMASYATHMVGNTQGLRTRISRLGALGKLGLPLLYSQAGQESNAFCSIDRQDHTTSSGTSAP